MENQTLSDLYVDSRGHLQWGFIRVLGLFEFHKLLGFRLAMDVASHA